MSQVSVSSCFIVGLHCSAGHACSPVTNLFSRFDMLSSSLLVTIVIVHSIIVVGDFHLHEYFYLRLDNSKTFLFS